MSQHTDRAADRVRVLAGDCREQIKTLPDNSVDALVTDGPYALVSIVKRFGKDGSAPAQAKDGGSGVYMRASSGFMGQTWDTGETYFSAEFWREVWRVLKPGAHVAAFCGDRTYHRMACAIEDAGFELRRMNAWLYGTGFPKSHDVERGIARHMCQAEGRHYERALPAEDKRRAGDHVCLATPESLNYAGFGTDQKPAFEPIAIARKPLIGTVAENMLAHGTGALHIDACRIDAEVATGWGGGAAGGNTWNEGNSGLCKPGEARPVDGRWPANVMHDGSAEVLAAFPASEGMQSGISGSEPSRNGFCGTVKFSGERNRVGGYEPRGDQGSAARFFFSAKADADDRMGSDHPTVKPVALMRWLVRLLVPRGGVVLDPFAGSGTTGIAAWAEGRSAILIEREPGYVADIAVRLAHADGAAAHSRSLKSRKRTEEPSHGPLFAAQ